MDLPPDFTSQAIIAQYARIWTILGPELGRVPLVLPNARFFPDAFEPSQVGVNTLMRRLQQHASVSDIPIKVQFLGEASPNNGGCGSGNCAPQNPAIEQSRIVDTGEHWQLSLSADEVRHPVALTTLLARALSAIVLEEVRGETKIPTPAALSCDLAAVQLGLGCLLLEGSYIYQKNCGGPSIAKLTALQVNELSVAVALFAAQQGHSLGAAKRAASTTQRAALRLAEELISSNSMLVKTMKMAPSALTSGDFELKPATPRFWGLFNKGQKVDDDDWEQALLDDNLELGQPNPSPTEQPTSSASRGPSPDDELKQLVRESLSESRAG